jgi:hypothetical protein
MEGRRLRRSGAKVRASVSSASVYRRSTTIRDRAVRVKVPLPADPSRRGGTTAGLLAGSAVDGASAPAGATATKAMPVAATTVTNHRPIARDMSHPQKLA